MIKIIFFISGSLILITHKADSRTGGPKLMNTVSEAEKNIGEKCFPEKFKCEPNYRYRMIDAGCTNLDIPIRGMAGTIFTRLLPALYQDNVREIRNQKSGKPLDSARVMSNVMFGEQKEKSVDKEFTLSMMQWGQVAAHDVSGTSGKKGPLCCSDDSRRLTSTTDNCVEIKVPTNDHFYQKFNKTCIHMSRTKSNEDLNCSSFCSILPINFVTAYLDSSLLYGSTINTNIMIRDKDGGKMKSECINGQMFPPNIDEAKTVCRADSNEENCIQAGDTRANTHPTLAVIQTILLRLHNKLANELCKLNPSWKDETLFQEARRIVIAIEQHITYKHFLPNLLGQKYMESIQLLPKDSGYNNVYDKNENPQMMTEFSGCAFRSLHSTIVDQIKMVNEDRTVVASWKFSEFYNKVGFLTEGENFKNLVIGLATEPQGSLDRSFPTSITDLLFQVNGLGGDMESLDIEKGRDMGINLYVKYLEMIGKPSPKSWDDYTTIPKNMIERLKTRYDCYDDVELFIGGVLEDDAEGAIIGPVFQAIIAEQFYRLQVGDRFYYENGDQIYPFTPEQLQQIRKTSLSFVYCYTCDTLQKMQPDAFRLISDNNKLMSCKDIIKEFSLESWKAKE